MDIPKLNGKFVSRDFGREQVVLSRLIRYDSVDLTSKFYHFNYDKVKV